MKIETINGHKVEYYDSIEEVPITRYHKLNKYLLIDSGIGSDINDIERHLAALAEMVERDDKEAAKKEIMNMRQNMHFVVAGLSPKMMSFACMVKSINGKPCDDLSDDGLQRTINELSEAGYGAIEGLIREVKKKLIPRWLSTSRKSREAQKARNYMFR